MQINIMSFLSLFPNHLCIRVEIMNYNTFTANTVAQLKDLIVKEGCGDALVYRVQPLYHAQEIYVQCYLC